MKKRLGGLLLLAGLGGCVTNEPGSFMSNVGPMGVPRGGGGQHHVSHQEVDVLLSCVREIDV